MDAPVALTPSIITRAFLHRAGSLFELIPQKLLPGHRSESADGMYIHNDSERLIHF